MVQYCVNQRLLKLARESLKISLHWGNSIYGYRIESLR